MESCRKATSSIEDCHLGTRAIAGAIQPEEDHWDLPSTSFNQENISRATVQQQGHPVQRKRTIGALLPANIHQIKLEYYKKDVFVLGVINLSVVSSYEVAKAVVFVSRKLPSHPV